MREWCAVNGVLKRTIDYWSTHRETMETMSEPFRETEEETQVVEELQREGSRKTFATIKEENDKLRTYLGLVKMCNYSAIAKVKSALAETIQLMNNDSNNDGNEFDSSLSSLIVKQLQIIEAEMTNMQSMHSKLEEGIESFQVIETSNALCGDDDHNRETVVVLTTRYEVPRKSTGITTKKANCGRNAGKSRNKSNKDPLVNAKLLSRVVETKSQKAFQASNESVVTEQQEAVASIDAISADDRENVANDLVRIKVHTKRPYISEEFKSSHLQRLVEAKRRREEMNKQLEREGKRKPRLKKGDELSKDGSETNKKSSKKRQAKKKLGTNGSPKKKATQPISTTQSIVVPLNQALDSLSGQTIQIIASGGTQTLALCRNDGTFIPSSNCWQTTNTQWTTDSNNFPSTQWSQFQS